MAEVFSQSEEGCIIDSIFEKPRTIKPLSAKWYINVFVENLIKKFRYYNSDEFVITISDLKNFVDLCDDRFSFLLSVLKDNGFTVIFGGDEKHVSIVNVSCRNETKEEDYNYVYQIQSLPSIIDLSAKTDIPVSAIIIIKESRILYPIQIGIIASVLRPNEPNLPIQIDNQLRNYW